MQVRTDISYPMASPEQVFALALDRDFRAAVCTATHALDYEIDIRQQTDGRALVVVERTLPADVPDVIKRFVGQTITIVQTEDWAPSPNGLRNAGLQIQVEGQPASMTGSLTIEPEGSGARERVEGDLKVSVPFFGGRIEAEVAKAILAAAATEQATGRAWLSRQV